MVIFEPLKKVFGRGKTLGDLRDEDLKREKIRLDRKAERMVREIDQLEVQKKQLFLKGKNATSERQRVIIARKIKELDVQQRNTEHRLQFISRQLRIVNGFIQLKENWRTLQESDLGDVLTKMDLKQLEAFAEQVSTDNAVKEENLRKLLEAIEEGQRLTDETQEDTDVLELVRLMQQAKEAESTPEAVEQSYQQATRLLDRGASEEEAELDL